MIIGQFCIAWSDSRYIFLSSIIVFFAITVLVSITYGQEENLQITINNNDYIEVISHDKPHCISLEEYKSKHTMPSGSTIPFIEELQKVVVGSCSYKILYKAKKEIFQQRVFDNKIINAEHKIIVDCFDINGKHIPGNSYRVNDSLAIGEVREATIGCQKNTLRFNVRVYSRQWTTDR